MKIIISGKQLKVTDAIKTYTEEKISRISKYSDAITEIDVVLTVEDTKSEGSVHKADGLVFASGTKIKIEAENKDLYAELMIYPTDWKDKLENIKKNKKTTTKKVLVNLNL